MQQHPEVIVIGGGVVGLATARAVARRGRSVRLLERHRPAHSNSSSHGSVRAFAFAHPFPEWVDRAAAAMPLWRELERERGATLVTRTGSGIRIPELGPIAERLESHSLEFEILAAEDASAKYAIDFEPGGPLLFTVEGGTIHADRAVRALHDSAVAHGAEIVCGLGATEIEDTGDGVLVHCADGGVHRADTAVVAAGPWARGLLAPLGIELPTRVWAETIAYFPFNDTPLRPCVHEEAGAEVYWVSAPREGLKIGEWQPPLELHDGDLERPVDPMPEQVQRLSAYVERHFPGVSATPTTIETCRTTQTDDMRFRLERRGNVVFAAACCGRGFKFSPLSGERLADLAFDADADPGVWAEPARSGA